MDKAPDRPGDHPQAADTVRTVLHVGCGPRSSERLHAIFRDGSWREVRVDIDPGVQPDVVASITDLSAFPDGSVEAVWSSHNIEHLHGFELPVALREFRRVLAPDGFLIVTTPDIEQVASLIAEGRIEEVAYVSAAGPITPLDILFGHQAAIAAGNAHMAHRTALTAKRLARLLVEAGFGDTAVQRGPRLDLWAIAFAGRDRLHETVRAEMSDRLLVLRPE